VLIVLHLLISIITSAQVSTNGRNIVVNGKNYIIRGVTYNPVPIGSSVRSWASLTQDIALMKEAHINTVRIYTPVDDVSVLDAFSNAGIKLIIGIGYNSNGNTAFPYDILSGSFITYINKYKTHPAILLWELGNEYNYHPEWFSGNVANWYTALNDAAAKVHQNDSGHPAATAHGELPNDQARNSCPNVDVWGMNVYRGDNPSGIFPQWAAVSGKPMYLSETGADSYMTISQRGYAVGPNEGMQADAVSVILGNVFKAIDVNSGVCLFSFVDEWWKAGNNNTQDIGGSAPNSSAIPYDGTTNEEYYGILDIKRNRKKAFFSVQDQYAKAAVLAGVKNNESSTALITSIYPNPVETSLNISTEVHYNKVILLDFTGKVVFSNSKNFEKQFSLDLSQIHSGAYTLLLQSDKHFCTRKFFKL
jgi:hypothetical protein